MTSLPTYHELWVVSDLHMGGRREGSRNFQVFDRGERLGGLIRRIAEQREGEDVALVLNGDVFDSLAEDEVPGYVALDSGTVEKMMKHLYTDAAFEPVWEALAHFIKKKQRHLVFTLGNHDIEMALPIVQDSIRDRLAGSNAAARSRIRFETHGGGFACQVAEARVFCTHGNEVDEWNMVDYNRLGQLANAINAGRCVAASEWQPNAGTQLVVDVMNNIKERYPFVDLLKPEKAAIASVLMALGWDLLEEVDLLKTFPILRKKIRDNLVKRKLLGPGEELDAIAPATFVGQLLGPSYREAMRDVRVTSPDVSEDELLLKAERAHAGGESATEMIAGEDAQATLGAWDLVRGFFKRVAKEEGLRLALVDWLKADKTFDLKNDDDLYKAMKERVGDQVDFVVTGHTHLARAMSFRGTGYYYNSGTWIRILRLTDEVLAEEVFKDDLWPVLRDGRMDDLDHAEIPGPNGKKQKLLDDSTYVVRISQRDDVVVGDLLRVTDGDTPGSVREDIEPGTQFSR